MAVTMKDVAKHANLSLGTVSNYVNGKASVSAKNRIKIEESIRALDYKVNEAARSLKTRNHRTIGVLIPTFSNVFLVKITNCIEELLREENYSMLVVSYNSDLDKEKELMLYLSQRCDGIIYAPTKDSVKSADLYTDINIDTPIVVLNEKVGGLVLDNVQTDNRESALLAVSQLLANGHRKIGLICGPHGFHTTKQRVAGYREAHESYNVSEDDNLIMYSDYSRRKAKEFCGELIDKKVGVTAIFVAGYRMTQGVLSELAERGLQNKISVIGFDAGDIADIVYPKLSYIHQPYKAMAEQVVKFVLKRANGDFEGFPTTMKFEAGLRNMDSIIKIKLK